MKTIIKNNGGIITISPVNIKKHKSAISPLKLTKELKSKIMERSHSG